MKTGSEKDTGFDMLTGEKTGSGLDLEKKQAPNKPIVIEYHFKLEEDQPTLFRIEIDPASMVLLNPRVDDLPEWARLQNHQCPNCPLDSFHEPFCPAAVNMVELVDCFGFLLSHNETTVSVFTAERCLVNQTTVQRGVCSLMGLLMAASRCPLTAFFKPMARFHLPFASTEETIWRATTTYLLAQYFLSQKGTVPDLDFEGLSRLYEQIETVNLAFAKRLRTACRHDSMINAIILLDMFAKSMPSAIDESLETLRHLFAPHLDFIASANPDGGSGGQIS